MNRKHFGLTQYEEEHVLIFPILKSTDQMVPTIGSRSKDTWTKRAKQKLKDLKNIILKKS